MNLDLTGQWKFLIDPSWMSSVYPFRRSLRKKKEDFVWISCSPVRPIVYDVISVTELFSLSSWNLAYQFFKTMRVKCGAVTVILYLRPKMNFCFYCPYFLINFLFLKFGVEDKSVMPVNIYEFRWSSVQWKSYFTEGRKLNCARIL